jgi:hypothetical protein
VCPFCTGASLLGCPVSCVCVTCWFTYTLLALMGCNGVRSGAGDGSVSVPRLCNCVALPVPGDSAGAYITIFTGH